jgi:putative membrane protein
MSLSLDSIVAFVLPWKFSLAVALACGSAVIIYLRGAYAQWRAGEGPGTLRIASFLAGVLAIYAVLQTRLDYWALHTFFMHRTQHLAVHHLGPFLIALSAPAATLVRGTPTAVRERVFAPIWRVPTVRRAYGIVQQPLIATALFLGIGAFWLMPQHHFHAMLSDFNYNAMNWSLLVDGLFFWWMMLEPSHRGLQGAPGYGTRILMQWVVIMALIGMGFPIMYSEHTLYPVYAICGRIWAIDPLMDQAFGGAITWMPTTIVSAMAAVILLGRWMRASGPNRPLFNSSLAVSHTPSL